MKIFTPANAIMCDKSHRHKPVYGLNVLLKRGACMSTPSAKVIRLDLPLRRLLSQPNTYPTARSCGRRCGDSHT